MLCSPMYKIYVEASWRYLEGLEKTELQNCGADRNLLGVWKVPIKGGFLIRTHSWVPWKYN